MKLAYVDLCGFRGYHKQLRIDFADGFTIIDGRNGVGKSTVFDAIAFALTGVIDKYGDAKADGETVADYIWWDGNGPVPVDRYVEVGFRQGDAIFSVRRTQLSDVDPLALDAIRERLCDVKIAPKSPLAQLCAASIIRDEYIAALSLDLKETERYTLLCDAIGATDADLWIEKASKLVSLAKKRVQAAEKEVTAAALEVSNATRRIDEIRAMLVEEVTLATAVSRLQAFAGTSATPDQLTGPARKAISEKTHYLEQLISLESMWTNALAERERLPALNQAVATARQAKARADEALNNLAIDSEPSASSDTLARQARDLTTLVVLGRQLGLHEGHCPLCASNQTEAAFANGLAIAATFAKQLDKRAMECTERERARTEAEAEAISAAQKVEQSEAALRNTMNGIVEFERSREAAGFLADASIDVLRERQRTLRADLNTAREDLRIIETLKLNTGLERAIRAEAEAKERYAHVEARLGLTRRTENRAQTLFDAARRAAGETVNRRLERVLPLMAELYRRLRPHPIWSDIEYKVRGDVRRFLKLQVGDGLNPQFIFSSGQRRATGLAFLLSVNLSLAWSRWQTILLDDPVQHVDDFRSIHLAEVMAQLAAAGKQIICTVEDAALADLLCRRLPVEHPGQAKRVTLGPDVDGAPSKLTDNELVPLQPYALVTNVRSLAS